MTTHKEALEAAYLAGFNASGEGYNGEYPFGDKMQDPAENRVWKKDRDNYIKEALAQPEQEPTNLERHKRNVQKFLGTQQPKEPEQDEYLSKAYRLANELRCHLAIAPAPQRKPLTDEELSDIYQKHHDCYGQPINGSENGWAYEREIIRAANGIKE